MRPSLRLAWADHKAALFACQNWHYSGCMPAGKTVKVGVWEDGKFVGVVVFSRGANNHLASPFGLTQTECVELTRIALTSHKTPVSRVVKVALDFLKKQSPGIRLVVSYADPEQGHHGGVYQAGNWIYTGRSNPNTTYYLGGKWVHGRTAGSLRGTVKGLPTRTDEGKHTYIMPLDKETRERLSPMARPYPKRPKGLSDVPTPGGRLDSDPDAPVSDHGRQTDEEGRGDGRDDHRDA